MEGSSFPVVFYDGKQEIGLENVAVSPSLSLESFQSAVGEKIGISTHQLSLYLADRKGSRLPLTSRLNVSAFSPQKGWFFLVVLKRSRRGRRHKGPDPRPTGNVTLLRRDGNSAAIGGFNPGGVGYERRVAELEVARERYLMNMGLGLGLGLEGLNLEGSNNGGGGAECEECSRGRRKSEFHWCVNDAITFRFRSPAGPIARPVNKGSV